MIIIFCSRENATGGTELLHQLGYKLNLLGFDAYMYYYGDESGLPATHPHFLKYNVPVRNTVYDHPDNYFIYPEVMISSLMEIKRELPQSKHILWWLSVDNAKMTSELKRTVSNDTSIIHLVQSYYAQDYVKNNLSVPDSRLYYLSDYINNEFLNVETDNPRDNVVLFNPRKGFERTSRLIQASDHRLKWQALAGLTPDEVPGLLRTAKVYIDFGNHPGKDRFPREATVCGCRIITGRRGAAANSKDIPIADQLKVFDDTDDDYILRLIYTLIDNYEQNESLYTSYMVRIKEEFHIFETDVLTVFSRIVKRDIEGWDMDAIGLKARILDAVQKENYKTAFFLLTVYRAKRFEKDDEITILECYTRLGIREEQVALYLVNELIRNDQENYEAYLIKARALIALDRNGVDDALNNAVRYSEDTGDEEYIREAVNLLR